MSSHDSDQRLTDAEYNVIIKILSKTDEEEDAVIAKALGRRTLTDDERERVRLLLADEMMKHGLLPDGSPTPEGRRVDTMIGKLMDY